MRHYITGKNLFLVCFLCGRAYSRKEWMDATIRDFGPPIIEIGIGSWKHCEYTCPGCNMTSQGQQLDIVDGRRTKETFEF